MHSSLVRLLIRSRAETRMILMCSPVFFFPQVNSWLTWLETADEEGTDSEAE